MYPFNLESKIPKQSDRVVPNFNGLHRNSFKNALANIPNMDEHQIAILIRNNIDEIVKDISSGEIPYINIFRDVKFINSFIRAINSIPIDYDIRLACNKLTYDYFTSEDAKPEIKQMYLSISRVVNKSEINQLMAIGLDENTSSNLTLCRYSSSNELTNVKRLNFTLYHKDPAVMTEQMIVWIYEKFFDRISDLFYGIMFEVYSDQEEIDFGENFMEVYGTVGLAVLDILNNMTTDQIRQVLSGYANKWEYSRPHIRFSLRSLSGDYARITNVVEELDTIGVYVP